MNIAQGHVILFQKKKKNCMKTLKINSKRHKASLSSVFLVSTTYHTEFTCGAQPSSKGAAEKSEGDSDVGRDI